MYTKGIIKKIMKSPLITIITVSYNAVATIEQTILSVINQSYSNIEYIIIDGGSTDGTVDIIKKYADKIACWISEPDKGIYDAMNKAIKIASGEWINFMNCGDSFYNNTVLEDVFNIADFSSDIIYGNTNYIYDVGNCMKKGTIATPENYMPFGHQASFSRTSLMKNRTFNLDYKICADRDFFHFAYKNNYRFEYIDIVIANYEAENGISSLNYINLVKEIGVIEGKNTYLIWKLKLILFIVTQKIKQYIKKVLPNKINRTIKKRNLLVMSNKNS